ncbi:hypothetical protein JCM3775_003041 [Rhodotorula graminis]
MVWVVQGTLNSEPHPSTSTESFPQLSSHYLRPNRSYRLGRAGGVRAPLKPGQDKPGPASRHRPYDFRIANLAISKDGLLTLDTHGADWDPLDNHDRPDNLEPYSLTLTATKKLELVRTNGEVVDIAPNETVVVHDGDSFHERNKGFSFGFTWRPVNLCFSAASAEKKKQYAAHAKKLGIKIAYRDFRAHHTHLVVKTAAPNATVTLAAMHRAHIVAPTFCDDLFQAGAPKPFPPADHVPVRPEPLAPDAGADDKAAHDRAVVKWERDVLDLEPDVGFDTGRWWGHCLLEQNWAAAWPGEDAHVPARWDGQDPTRWAIPRAERATLFQNVLLVNLRGSPEADAIHGALVTLGGGTYFPCALLQHSPLPTSIEPLLDAIETFKAAHVPATDAGAASRIAIFPPEGVLEPVEGASEDEIALGEQQKELVQELQHALQVPKLCSPDGRDLATAIYDLNLDALFPVDVGQGASAAQGDDVGGPDVGRSTSRRTQTTQALTQATPPFPTGGVPGTHPDSGMPAPTASGSGSAPAASTSAAAAAVAAGAGAGASQEGSESGQSQPRKLTRRARTGRTVLDSMFADLPAEETARPSSSTARPHDLAGGTLDSTSLNASASGGAGMDVDAAPSTSAAPAHGDRMPRRRAGRTAVELLLDTGDDSPDHDRGGGRSAEAATQSTHDELMRTSMTREQRRAALKEEDERLAREEQEGRAQDRGEPAAPGKKRRVRVSPSASESEGEEEGGGRARKRGWKKGGDAPVATLKKRTRAQSRDPTAAVAGTTSSDDDEEGARRAARKKSKAPQGSSPPPPGPTAARAPKNKKEAAALKKAEKAAQEAAAQRLLQVKPTKRRGGETDNQFTEEFNALKIVRPKLQAMPQQEHRRMRWNDEDSDVERERLIVEDEARAEQGERDDDGDDDMDPDQWRRPTQAMFVLRSFDVERKTPRAAAAAAAADGEVDERWAGKPNFKKFRHKNSKAPRAPFAQRAQVELTVPDLADFGLGPGYNDRKGTTFTQVQQADDEDDEDELFADMATTKGQTKLSFGKKAPTTSKTKGKAPVKPKSAPKSKGKGKQIVADSDDDDDDDKSPRSSHTLRDDFDELDDDEPAPPQRQPAPTRRAAARKPVPTVMLDDSDSESDSGLTFKGFGKKAATGRARR